MTDPSNQPAIGENIGRYKLVRRVAHGGMAEVYLGRHVGAHGFEKTVAIKRVLSQHTADPQFMRMMVDEARITVQLAHPNVAQILELGTHGEDLFIVMEYVPGHALGAMLKRLYEGRRRLEPAMAAFIVSEMLAGLHAAHTARGLDGAPLGIIHRDVSPQNVLVSYDGHVKLIDFGIAKAQGRLETTQAGVIKGKLRYMAPEMIDRGRFGDAPIDHRVDIFAAGIVLHELITGRALFRGKGDMEVYRSVLEDPIPDLGALGLCSPELMAVVSRALARDPAARYQDAATFGEELRAQVFTKDPTFSARRVAAMMQGLFAEAYQKSLVMEPDGSADSELVLTRTALRPTQNPTETAADVTEEGPAAGPSLSGPATRAERPAVQLAVHAAATAEAGPVVARPVEPGAEPLTTPTAIVPVAPASHWPIVGAAAAALAVVAAGGVWMNQRGQPAAPASPPMMAAADTAGADIATRHAGAQGGAPQAPVKILFDGTPAGARVERVDGTLLGELPCEVEAVPGSALAVRMRAPGYQESALALTVPAGDGHVIPVALDPARVDVDTAALPAGTTVLVNGAPVGGPLTLMPGEKATLALTRPDGATASFEVTPRIGMPVVLGPQRWKTAAKKRTRARRPASGREGPRQASARPARVATAGKARVTFAAPGTWAHVRVDGKTLGDTTPITVTLRAGKHRVEFKGPSGQRSKRTIRVVAGEAQTVRARF